MGSEEQGEGAGAGWGVMGPGADKRKDTLSSSSRIQQRIPSRL